MRKVFHFLGCKATRFSIRQELSSLKAQQLRQELAVDEATLPDQNIANLVDTYGRHHTYLRISIAEKCNLRCTYCMPEEGVPLSPSHNLLNADEIVRLATIFAASGVTKIRLTGGEPTLRKDIVDIVGRLASIPGINQVGMTTNGIALRQKLEALASVGLSKLNISLDTLNEAKYMIITRRNGFNKVMRSIELAESIFDQVKINNVVIRGINDEELTDFVSLTEFRNLDVRFIEYMPFGGNKFELRKMVPYKEMLKTIDKKFPMIVKLKDLPSDTSKAYSVQGFRGKFGFISSMSEHFCASCSRLRITADGNLKVCLHGNSEVSLRDALRGGASDKQIEAIVRDALSRKKKQHAGQHIKRFTHTSTWKSVEKLSHVCESGKARMVDVTDKAVTSRTAIAQCILQVNAEVMKAIVHNELKKGDAIGVARIAGIQAAKRTSALIPLCHNIFISNVKITFHLDEAIYFSLGFYPDAYILRSVKNEVVIRSVVRTKAETGVEMEALTAVTVAALTLYDMCKAITHNMILSDVRLIAKSGGKRDFGRCE
uniref:Radical SAM core domain-containing protein n=1 Tax=Ascaris lumbricoides TaxID=6252 RepID=A0A9J2P6R7_ASCLU